ncbi:MAG: hypothetical protein EP343_32200 [Deltaproteobacteria bacterium]|nr:MAG: hypothetical protein EP343_32200 [Deltaproteobacteria bacterium]
MTTERQLASWRESFSQTLRESLVSLLRDQAVHPKQEALLLLAMHEFDRRERVSHPIAMAHQLPALAYFATTGELPQAEAKHPATALCRVSSLLEMGIDILDHIADRELGRHWDKVPLEAVQLLATGLIGSMTHLAVAELEAQPEILAQLHKEIARGLVRIGAGQQLDFQAQTTSDATAALKKTGGRYALYTRLGARLAGANDETCEHWTTVGVNLGAARQLLSDCTDLFADESRDLASGIRTWPIAWLLEKVERKGSTEQRAALEGILQQASQGGKEAQRRLQEIFQEQGGMRRVALEIEVYCQHALQGLAATEAKDTASSWLRFILTQPSLGRADGPHRPTPP